MCNYVVNEQVNHEQNSPVVLAEDYMDLSENKECRIYRHLSP